ncbi:MAG: sodium:solute symporter family protein [Piscinibacter sp.]|uniref:sodium:solute symporter family protein n=1 Tax=Piscinibacter sp. TaxID=1903157 RepID=UPI0035AE176F
MTGTEGDAASALARRRIDRRYLAAGAAFAVFIAAMFALERLGLSRRWIAAVFLLGPVVVYAGIGLAARTMQPADYYVAGRRVPAIYNGMAIGADWMSVASFMSLTGILYVTGFGGLAYVIGWTGGFCLIAFALAPYLRRFGQYTIPDFLAERYGGWLVRVVGLAVCALICFIYVVAQIYGVGLITSRLTGFAFELGVLVGLGGILVCSFLGGMRAVTWTQVAQYAVMLVAFLLPVVWLSFKQTGIPLPQVAAAVQVHKLAERERQLRDDPAERQVMEAYRAEAARYERLLQDPERSLAQERAALQRRLSEAITAKAPVREIHAIERSLHAVPPDAAAARETWERARRQAAERAARLGGMPVHAQPFGADPDGTGAERDSFENSRINFIALVFCLMAGTAGMPHILARFYTTPTVRAARQSVTWAVLFIVLVYVSAPVLALLLKVEVFSGVVGLRFDRLPAWIVEWSRVDPSLLSVVDLNRDGILQLGELRINGDILVLAAPDIGGMPFVVSCLVAAGALAAALSTADGLLLTTSNALTHDLYFSLVDPGASPTRRVAISKVVLMVVALLAAYIATRKPATILHLVTPVFSIAAATLFPALVLGVLWKRANRWGACAGMLAGLGVTLYYLATRDPLLGAWFGDASPEPLWWGIQANCAGVFGVPVAFAVAIATSLVTRAPVAASVWVDAIRRPDDAA